MNDLIKSTDQFPEVIQIIKTARENAYRKVNEELVMMYWHIGEYIHLQSEDSAYGDKLVQSLADFIAQNYPEMKGFNRRGLYRMRQFYETYQGNVIVSPL